MHDDVFFASTTLSVYTGQSVASVRGGSLMVAARTAHSELDPPCFVQRSSRFAARSSCGRGPATPSGCTRPPRCGRFALLERRSQVQQPFTKCEAPGRFRAHVLKPESVPGDTVRSTWPICTLGPVSDPGFFHPVHRG
jgi:hypothetical protein